MTDHTMGDADADDHDRAECRSADATRRAERLLEALCLTPAERAFARIVGEQILDVVDVAYAAPLTQAAGCGERCMAAAAAFALSVLYDPAPH